jgi:hypothetical protein
MMPTPHTPVSRAPVHGALFFAPWPLPPQAQSSPSTRGMACCTSNLVEVGEECSLHCPGREMAPGRKDQPQSDGRLLRRGHQHGHADRGRCLPNRIRRICLIASVMAGRILERLGFTDALLRVFMPIAAKMGMNPAAGVRAFPVVVLTVFLSGSLSSKGSDGCSASSS